VIATHVSSIYARQRQAKKKQFIAKIQDGDATVTSQADKLEKVHDYFRRILGSTENREGTLNWESLGYTQKNMEDLEFPITGTELSNTIKELPSQRAPGPDGFIGAFYKSFWGIITNDLLEAIQGFFNHRTGRLHFINNANIVLIPKKEDYQQHHENHHENYGK